MVVIVKSIKGDSLNKIKFGQFFTRNDYWLKPQVKSFILSSNCSISYDPFAGEGDLLNVSSKELNFKSCIGLDIDRSLKWRYNDSLKKIPHVKNAIIITNPPYFAKQSASKKNVDLKKYFNNTIYTDLYLLALDKMLESADYVVAIVPESFINSSYAQKDRLNSITILEDNPFKDTENPVCVVCFDKFHKPFSEIKVFKNNDYLGVLSEIFQYRIKPNHNTKILFNDKKGWLGLRAVDSTNDNVGIHFDFKRNFKYNWEEKIKTTSRHFSLINIDIPNNQRLKFINICNKILNEIRLNSHDIILTPFKGNTKSGRRRRRLDFSLARAIMENAKVQIGEKK